MRLGLLQDANPSTLIKQIMQRPEFAHVDPAPPSHGFWDILWAHLATNGDWLAHHSPSYSNMAEALILIIPVSIAACVGVAAIIAISRHVSWRIHPQNPANPPSRLTILRPKTIAEAETLAKSGAYPEAIAGLFEVVVLSCITKNILPSTPSATPYEYADALPKKGTTIYSGFSVVAPLAVLAVFAREELTLEDWRLARSATQAVLESSE